MVPIQSPLEFAKQNSECVTKSTAADVTTEKTSSSTHASANPPGRWERKTSYPKLTRSLHHLLAYPQPRHLLPGNPQ